MINNSLLDIDRVLGIVNTHPEFRQCVLKEKKKSLLDDAKRYSLEIERIESSKAYDNLCSAENILFYQGIGISTLQSLGSIVEPEKNVRHFRSIDPLYPNEIVENPKPYELKIHPPKASEVPFQIESLLYYLSHTDDHSVIRASESHLEFARIHPFIEGNGRIARLIQNYCLSERGYPAARIIQEERELYRELLQNALEERVSGKSNSFKHSKYDLLFHDFIASKVLSSLNDLKSELSKNRAYKIYFNGRNDPGITHSIARAIRSHGRIEGSGVKVSYGKKNDHKGVDLLVMGDLSKQDVEDTINSFKSKRKLNYRIETLGC